MPLPARQTRLFLPSVEALANTISIDREDASDARSAVKKAPGESGLMGARAATVIGLS